jgi:hypothetical protein
MSILIGIGLVALTLLVICALGDRPVNDVHVQEQEEV